MKDKLVHGWGINDVDYAVSITKETSKINGKRKHDILWVCPYYTDWRNMLLRVLSPKYHKIGYSYYNCAIFEEWKYFSNFIKWVDSQPNRDWQNCSLDKDLLVLHNKVYSPETCAYIPTFLNSFLVEGQNRRGRYMLGTSLKKTSKVRPFQSHCSDPFKEQNTYIGTFATELEAHKAWQAKKHEYACQLADLQDDIRVADALRQRYAPDKDWSNK